MHVKHLYAFTSKQANLYFYNLVLAQMALHSHRHSINQFTVFRFIHHLETQISTPQSLILQHHKFTNTKYNNKLIQVQSNKLLHICIHKHFRVTAESLTHVTAADRVNNSRGYFKL